MQEPMLLKEWRGQNVSGWLMSEKFDGVRSLWDGQKLISREGNDLNAPAWFTQSLPTVALDGELVCGDLQKTISVVRTGNGWEGMKLMVFDAPSDEPLNKRLNVLRLLDLPGHCTKVSYRINEKADFMSYEEEIFSRGGEGVVLRDGNAGYTSGRSSRDLKFKRTSTCEGTVMGKAGDYVKLYHNGKLFKIRGRAQVGDLVTFSFSGETRGGVPRSPRFISVRDYE